MFGRLLAQMAAHGYVALSGVRCRLSSDVYRLPDIALFRSSEVRAVEVPSNPPLMIAEIVSRNEERVALIAKLSDYAAWGVPHIWVIDPWNRRLAVWQSDIEVPVEALTLPEYGFEVRLEQLTEGLPL